MRKLTSLFALLATLTIVTGLTLVAPPSAHAQATLSSGGIVGTILDPNGASVGSAKITVTSKATGQKYTPTVSGAGEYSVASLTPGEYVVRVEAQGFKTVERTFIVLVGQIASGNMTLEVGSSSTVVSVEASAISVNTDQSTVSGVLTAAQIDNLPVNGRNFLDLAQLEPGVQIQEGSTFDPTKNGFSSISFGGRFGRTARIEVDGVDVSDETVGTTTQNIPASAIQEFQLSQSSLDLSTELTSSGSVNVTTRSGTNDIHGEAFGLFRGNQTAAALPFTISPPPFQREQFGGRAGGRIIKDKLFWFVDAERNKQDLAAAEPFSGPFAALPTTLTEPFREVEGNARVDYVISGSTRAFYRWNFDGNSQIRPFGSASSLQGFLNRDHTQTHVAGFDFNTGTYTHSIRFEYLKFRNAIADGTANIGGIDNPIPGLGIGIGAPAEGNCVLSGGGSYCGGPNLLAPQETFQTNKQVKYDGSKIIGKHILRYGAAFNHIQGGGLAAFFTFPQAGTTNNCTTAANPCPAADMPSDPTLYPIQFAFLGNGIGFSTAEKAFGLPGGGLGPDNRFEAYGGDSWKIRRNVTVTAGLHYVIDTGRVDSNLGPLPILNQWAPGLGDQVHTPKDNFAPQVGVAWDLTGSGKTVIRAGGGLFYENSIWNNVLFDSPGRIPMGVFSDTPLVCINNNPNPFTWPVNPGGLGTQIAGGAGTVVATPGGGVAVSPNFCGATIGSAGSQVIALSNAFKAAAASNVGLTPNSNFIGTSLANCGNPGNTCTVANASGFDIFDPRYKSPRSWQMNVGIQHELWRGMVVSADYIRNIGEHYLIAIDQNHSGSARSFNMANAIAARDKAQTAAGCPTGAGQSACMITALGVSGAQAAYSGAGLDSNIAVTGGGPCPFCAFPGVTPVNGNGGALGVLDTLEPLGRSVYNGLQIKLVQRMEKPFRGVKSANFQFSYSLSKFVSQVQDQDFINLATNNDSPLQFTGPNGLDRRHQLSFGGFFDLPFYTRLSLIGHFYSPLPQNILLPFTTSGGEIFASDYLGSGIGSGAVGEPVPGTQIGQFGGGGTSVAGLQNIISNYNAKFAGTLTPAGLQLTNNGVMTTADMTALGWVMPTLPNVSPTAVNFTWLKSFDLSLAWPIPIMKDNRLTITPSVSAFNLFNFSNAYLPGNLPVATLGNPNSIGMVSAQQITPFLASFQSGTYALGAPRQFEFGLKVDF